MDDQKTSVQREEAKWQNKYISDNVKLKITNDTTIASQNKDAPTITHSDTSANQRNSLNEEKN